MSWTYTNDFEAYTTGALDGQDSWAKISASDNSVQVQTSVVSNGSKAVSLTQDGATNVSAARSITAESTDNSIVYLALRSSVTSDTGNFFVRFRDNGNTVMSIYINGTNGKIQSRSSTGTWYDIVSSFTADTFYIVGIEFDFTNNQWRDNVDNGTFSSWHAFGASRTDVDNIWFQANAAGSAAGTYYIDNITNTYPTGGGGGSSFSQAVVIM